MHMWQWQLIELKEEMSPVTSHNRKAGVKVYFEDISPPVPRCFSPSQYPQRRFSPKDSPRKILPRKLSPMIILLLLNEYFCLRFSMFLELGWLGFRIRSSLVYEAVLGLDHHSNGVQGVQRVLTMKNLKRCQFVIFFSSRFLHADKYSGSA
jgi:hypothetical protein